MNEYSTAVLNGKIDAISLVLNQVLMTLSPHHAAQIAAGLAAEQEALRLEADDETPEEEIAVQERMLGLYVGLLSAVAQRG
ncbi:MAG: hypothetical protein QE495_01420 [Acidovorax sp.]|uniref:hypothetical protein n=1 Tax=Acidovorax sp. TaxID=1872122 RepID=UPI0026390B27|nr:hypothetical protein [Acidovorax sp.]MDH4425087.1 hypothetical protein [Acidovorax sp.]